MDSVQGEENCLGNELSCEPGAGLPVPLIFHQI